MNPHVKPSNGGFSILAVDDSTFNLGVMEGILGREGYRVFTVSDSEAALRIMADEHIDLAVLDVMMPGMNGYDLCRRLKSMSGKRFFPVILVTALSEVADKVAGIEAGADDFLPKPFHTVELTAKIRSLLKLKKLQDELDHSEDIILTLAVAIEAKDPYTKGHSERVGNISMSFARHIGFSDEDSKLLYKAGVLHDIGKIGIDDHILHKSSNLTDEETRLIQEHVTTGENICMPLYSARRVLPVIRHHHERWDGGGFPDGLSGEQIPFFARIVSIADSFDAMVSTRPYRAAFSTGTAVGRMKSERSSGQWDPDLLDRFVEMMSHPKGDSEDIG